MSGHEAFAKGVPMPLTPQEVIQFLVTRGYEGKYINEKGDLEGFEIAHPLNGNYFFEASLETKN